jgi:hypothetical protein
MMRGIWMMEIRKNLNRDSYTVEYRLREMEIDSLFLNHVHRQRMPEQLELFAEYAPSVNDTIRFIAAMSGLLD